MKQGSNITRAMAEAQEAHARKRSIGADSTFRLYFEDKADDGRVAVLVGRFFPGFTSWHTVGHWMGEPEAARVVEVVAPSRDRARVAELAERIRYVTNQSCVLMTESACVQTMVH